MPSIPRLAMGAALRTPKASLSHWIPVDSVNRFSTILLELCSITTLITHITLPEFQLKRLIRLRPKVVQMVLQTFSILESFQNVKDHAA